MPGEAAELCEAVGADITDKVLAAGAKGIPLFTAAQLRAALGLASS